VVSSLAQQATAGASKAAAADKVDASRIWWAKAMSGRKMRWALCTGSVALVYTAVLALGYWRAVSRVHIHIGLVSAQGSAKGAPVFNAQLVVRDLAGMSLQGEKAMIGLE